MLRCCFVDEVISVFVILAPAYFHKQRVGTKEKNVAIFKEYFVLFLWARLLELKVITFLVSYLIGQEH